MNVEIIELVESFRRLNQIHENVKKYVFVGSLEEEEKDAKMVIETLSEEKLLPAIILGAPSCGKSQACNFICSQKYLTSDMRNDDNSRILNVCHTGAVPLTSFPTEIIHCEDMCSFELIFPNGKKSVRGGEEEEEEEEDEGEEGEEDYRIKYTLTTEEFEKSMKSLSNVVRNFWDSVISSLREEKGELFLKGKSDVDAIQEFKKLKLELNRKVMRAMKKKDGLERKVVEEIMKRERNPVKCIARANLPGIRGFRLVDLPGYSHTDLQFNNETIISYAKKAFCIIYLLKINSFEASKHLEGKDYDLLIDLKKNVPDFLRKTVFCGTHLDVKMDVDSEEEYLEEDYGELKKNLLSRLRGSGGLTGMGSQVRADRVHLVSLKKEKLSSSEFYRGKFVEFCASIRNATKEKMGTMNYANGLLGTTTNALNNIYFPKFVEEEMKKQKAGEKGREENFINGMKKAFEEFEGFLNEREKTLIEEMEKKITVELLHKSEVCSRDISDSNAALFKFKRVRTFYEEKMHDRICQVCQNYCEEKKIQEEVNKKYYQILQKFVKEDLEKLKMEESGDGNSSWSRFGSDLVYFGVMAAPLASGAGIVLGAFGVGLGSIGTILASPTYACIGGVMGAKSLFQSGGAKEESIQEMLSMFGSSAAFPIAAVGGVAASSFSVASIPITVGLTAYTGITEVVDFLGGSKVFGPKWRKKFVKKNRKKIIFNYVHNYIKHARIEFHSLPGRYIESRRRGDDVTLQQTKLSEESENCILDSFLEISSILHAFQVAQGERGNMNDDLVGMEVAGGAYGKIFLCGLEGRNPPDVARKKSEIYRSIMNRNDHKRRLPYTHKKQKMEAFFMFHFNHPNIMSTTPEMRYPFITEEEIEVKNDLTQEMKSVRVRHINSIMPYVPDTLWDRLREESSGGEIISSDLFVQYLLDIADGLEYLHKRHHIHRDLKPNNILIDRQQGERAIICDFGFTKKKSTSKLNTYLVGNPLCNDPRQTYGKEKYSCEVDVFSYGIILLLMWDGKVTSRITPETVNEEVKSMASIDSQVWDEMEVNAQDGSSHSSCGKSLFRGLKTRGRTADDLRGFNEGGVSLLEKIAGGCLDLNVERRLKIYEVKKMLLVIQREGIIVKNNDQEKGT